MFLSLVVVAWSTFDSSAIRVYASSFVDDVMIAHNGPYGLSLGHILDPLATANSRWPPLARWSVDSRHYTG